MLGGLGWPQGDRGAGPEGGVRSRGRLEQEPTRRVTGGKGLPLEVHSGPGRGCGLEGPRCGRQGWKDWAGLDWREAGGRSICQSWGCGVGRDS